MTNWKKPDIIRVSNQSNPKTTDSPSGQKGRNEMSGQNGTIPKKTDIVREAVAAGEMKKALRIAKGFRINITAEQRDAMSRAYECMVHPDFYRQIGTDIPTAIEKGICVVTALYGA